jgi:hypothetical protein
MQQLPAIRAFAPALTAGFTALFVSCHGGGSEEARQPISTFNAGFTLRQDVQLGTGSVTDVVVIDLNGDGIDDIVETDFFDRKIRSAFGNPDGSFTPFFALGTPSTPWALESGDFNGDMVVDFAAVCSGANGGAPSVVVYRGLGDGSFVQDAILLLAGEPLDLAVGRPAGAVADHLFVVVPGLTATLEIELTSPGVLTQLGALPTSSQGSFQPVTATVLDGNGDGLVDVIVGEQTGDALLVDRIVMHASDGLGGYAAPVVLTPIAFYPIVDNAGDVDGDGTDDLVAAQLESDRALLFLGSASGLAAPIEVSFTGATSSLVFADFNRDGIKDVAATMIDDDAVAVRLATAPLVFGPQQTFNVGQFPRSIAVGVFGSGLELDLLCSNIRDVSILHGDGNGSFRGARGFPVGDEPQFVRVVDMDNDGIVDVVSIDQFQNKVVFMKGMGNGTFKNMGQIPLSPTALETAGYLLIEDFDEDGAPDVATTVNSSDKVQLMRNTGSLPFAQPDAQDSTFVGNSPLGLDASDLDGDNHLDIVVANAGDKTIQVLLGHGDGTFSPRGAVAAPFTPLVVSIADWNNDGRDDVAVSTGNPDGTDAYLLLYEGDGAGGMTLVAQQKLSQLASVLSIGDFDEDGLPDIAASQPRVSADNVLVMINRGNFLFSISALKVGFRMGTVEVFDINNDTHLDLIVPLRDGQLILALGDGQGRFPTLLPPSGEQFPAPFGVSTSAFADVDGDSLPDLLMVSPRNPHLWVALNEGSAID